VLVAGRSAGTLPSSSLQLLGSNGWTALGEVSGPVPAAPSEREVVALSIVAGTYNGVRLGDDQAALRVVVTAGQVEPLLLGIESGRLIAGAAYAGNDQVNLGLGELAGKFVAMPAFELQDQHGHPFDNRTTAGKDLVIAAFHTSCHQTCPLYTALLAQLDKQLPEGAMLVEVTTDPATDTPAVLDTYARSIGARWTFATGSTEALTAFWKPFGVALASGDSHVSTLVLVDSHGYIRLVYRGVPNVGHAIAPDLLTQLGAEGLRELASGGDGWGTPDVLQSLLTIAGPERPSESSGGRAPGFSLTATDGKQVDLAGLLGRPLVINFWRTYCPPCRAEMPMLQSRVGAEASVRLVLINEGDSPQQARSFLDSVGVRGPALLDSNLRVAYAYGVVALPGTVFVRADGTIAGRQIGQLDERVLVAQLSNLTGQ
jgi:cytochrome oxidase Cu insertion factor (SCO1/SenC/PrrC family)